MFNRKLKRRIKALEEFLGLNYKEGSDGWGGEYTYNVTDYGRFQPTGVLGELKQDFIKRQEPTIPKPK